MTLSNEPHRTEIFGPLIFLAKQDPSINVDKACTIISSYQDIFVTPEFIFFCFPPFRYFSISFFSFQQEKVTRFRVTVHSSIPRTPQGATLFLFSYGATFSPLVSYFVFFFFFPFHSERKWKNRCPALRAVGFRFIFVSFNRPYSRNEPWRAPACSLSSKNAERLIAERNKFSWLFARSSRRFNRLGILTRLLFAL